MSQYESDQVLADLNAQFDVIAQHNPELAGISRRAFTVAGLAGISSLILPGSDLFTAPAAATEASDHKYRIASMPDFMNADIADLRELPNYHRGMPNSINERYRKAADVVLDAVVREGVTDVAVAGDLVNGRWGIDTANTGLFGPLKTEGQRQHAVTKAAGLYYPQWMNRFSKRGLKVYGAVGDHEIGDDPWHGSGGGFSADYNRFKQRNVPHFKDVFSAHILHDHRGRRMFTDRPEGPAANTAYATRLHPNVELITLDVWKQTKDNVAIEIDSQQMNWLKDKLQSLNEEGDVWKIVQLHTPIITPVRTVGSTGLTYKGGANSALWKTMKQFGVNLVLNGEVHAITAHQPEPGDPVQISHGGLFAYGLTNYGLIEVNENTLEFTAKDFRDRVAPNKHALWQTTADRKLPAWVKYSHNPRTVGRLVLTQDGHIQERTGLLRPYKGTRKETAKTANKYKWIPIS